MHKLLIKCVNCALLVLIVIGIPAMTQVKFGSYEIGSGPKYKLLLFWSLALALVLNIAVTFFLKNKKDRVLCWEWAAVFGVVLFAYCAFAFGYFNFDWLRNFLLRL
jgi:hypothetical protein